MEMEDYFFQIDEKEEKDLVLVLVIYDIVNTKRRNKLAKYLEGYGNRVQKSAFEAKITKTKYEKLLRELPRYCDKTEDSIRVYKIIGKSHVTSWGIKSELNSQDIIVL